MQCTQPDLHTPCFCCSYLKLRKVDDEEAERQKQLQSIQVGDSQPKDADDALHFESEAGGDCLPPDLPRNARSAMAAQDVTLQLQAERVFSDSNVGENPFMRRLDSWNHVIGSTLISKELASKSKPPPGLQGREP